MLYVGLGSNIGQREENLRRALQALGESVGEMKACSKFYETEPQGFRSNNLFLNAAAAIETTLPPETILRLTQTIERTLGRKHKSQAACIKTGQSTSTCSSTRASRSIRPNSSCRIQASPAAVSS